MGILDLSNVRGLALIYSPIGSTAELQNVVSEASGQHWFGFWLSQVAESCRATEEKQES